MEYIYPKTEIHKVKLFTSICEGSFNSDFNEHQSGGYLSD